jgi:hypothetical protein
MNPPTIGHAKVFETMQGVGGDFKIFVSQSQDKKENPLSYGEKINFIKSIHPQYAKNIVEDAGLNTVGKVCTYLYEQGYRNATFVAGSDRLPAFEKLIGDYNGVEGKAHGFYKFEVLDFVSAGARDPDSPGVEGVSASKARAEAAAGNLDGFEAATGAGQYAKPMFDAVRKGMGFKEEVGETKRMSAAVKLQRAWDRERAKSDASRERMRRELELIAGRTKPQEEPKKEVDEAGFLSFLKSEPPKKKWNPATDSRVVSNKKDDDIWIKLLIDKKRRGIELTNREWHDLESWKLKQSMKKDDVNSTHVGK